MLEIYHSGPEPSISFTDHLSGSSSQGSKIRVNTVYRYVSVSVC